MMMTTGRILCLKLYYAPGKRLRVGTKGSGPRALS